MMTLFDQKHYLLDLQCPTAVEKSEAQQKANVSGKKHCKVNSNKLGLRELRNGRLVILPSVNDT